MRPEAQNGDPQPHMIDGRYAVEAALGQGGVGTVYSVVDTSNGAHLALKQLRTEAGERATALIQQASRVQPLRRRAAEADRLRCARGFWALCGCRRHTGLHPTRSARARCA